MAVQANKWVVAAIAAVKWSALVDMSDSAAVAEICDFFGFNVASLWIKNHPQGYQLALEDGFVTDTPISEEERDHALMHIAVVLSVRGSDLIEKADDSTTDRILAIIAEKLNELPDVRLRPARRKAAPALNSTSMAPGFMATR